MVTYSLYGTVWHGEYVLATRVRHSLRVIQIALCFIWELLDGRCLAGRDNIAGGFFYMDFCYLLPLVALRV